MKFEPILATRKNETVYFENTPQACRHLRIAKSRIRTCLLEGTTHKGYSFSFQDPLFSPHEIPEISDTLTEVPESPLGLSTERKSASADVYEDPLAVDNKEMEMA